MEQVKLLKTAEACERLNISRRTLYEMIREDRIKAVKLGPRTIRFHPEEVERVVSDAK